MFFKKRKLAEAVRNKDLAKVKELIAAGAKPGVRMLDDTSWPPQKEIAIALLEAGKGRFRTRMLDRYAHSIRFVGGVDAEWVRKLVDAGATPTPEMLGRAQSDDDKELGRALIARGVIPDSLTMARAATNQRDEVWVKMLLEAGGEPQSSLLDLKVYKQDWDIAKMLIIAGAVPSPEAVKWAIDRLPAKWGKLTLEANMYVDVPHDSLIRLQTKIDNDPTLPRGPIVNLDDKFNKAANDSRREEYVEKLYKKRRAYSNSPGRAFVF